MQGSNATPDAQQTAKTVMFSRPAPGLCFKARFPFKNLKRKVLGTEKQTKSMMMTNYWI